MFTPEVNAAGDRGILMVGTGRQGPWPNPQDVLLLRLRPDGTPDSTFGPYGNTAAAGQVRLDLGGDDVAQGVYLLPSADPARPQDYKILVTGSSDGKLFLMRLNADGSRDATFGPAGATGNSVGVVKYDLTAIGQFIVPTTVSGTPYLLIAGRMNNGVFVARVTTSGRLDNAANSGSSAFAGGAGYVAFQLVRDTGESFVGGVSVDTAGRIVVGGTGWNSSLGASSVSLRRFSASGAIDATFGNNSYATPQIAIGGGGSLHVRPDGSYVMVAGTAGTNAWTREAPDDFIAIAFTSTGQIDTSFGTGGVTRTDINLQADVGSAAATVGPDGRLIVVGTTSPAGSGEVLALAQFTGAFTPATRSYARHDANFNVTSTITLDGSRNSQGVLTTSTERYSYTPYGVATVLNADFTLKGDGSWSASSLGWKLGFQGGRVDAALGGAGLYNFRNRWYDPVQGRWTQADPAGYVDGGGLYGFGRGNPYNNDPLGLQSLGVGGGGPTSQPIMPTTGSEPPYNPGGWNTPVIQPINNCGS